MVYGITGHQAAAAVSHLGQCVGSLDAEELRDLFVGFSLCVDQHPHHLALGRRRCSLHCCRHL